jgi:TRAP-type C4-dicarboxylate transport system permease small subunit
MWRARMWIPYGAMPIGLGILTLQYVAEIYNLVTGRAPPFGLKPGDAGHDVSEHLGHGAGV